MDWLALIAFLIERWSESKAKQNFGTDQEGVVLLRRRPIIAKLAIRQGLKEQGLRGIALHNAIQDAIQELDDMSDSQILDQLK